MLSSLVVKCLYFLIKLANIYVVFPANNPCPEASTSVSKKGNRYISDMI